VAKVIFELSALSFETEFEHVTPSGIGCICEQGISLGELKVHLGIVKCVCSFVCSNVVVFRTQISGILARPLELPGGSGGDTASAGHSEKKKQKKPKNVPIHGHVRNAEQQKKIMLTHQ
jgi:hypothetical protein